MKLTVEFDEEKVLGPLGELLEFAKKIPDFVDGLNGKDDIKEEELFEKEETDLQPVPEVGTMVSYRRLPLSRRGRIGEPQFGKDGNPFEIVNITDSSVFLLDTFIEEVIKVDRATHKFPRCDRNFDV